MKSVLRINPALLMAEKWFFDAYIEIEPLIPDMQIRLSVTKVCVRRQIYFLIDQLKSAPGNEQTIKELTLVLKQLRKYTFSLPGGKKWK